MSAVKANVYTMIGHDLDPKSKSSITDGLDILGQYMGGISVVKTPKVRLPMTAQGTVRTERVGYGGMDPKIDLHLLVAPLAGKSGLLGAAYSGSGVAYINTATPKSATGVTAAHESAHAFGYVLDGSPQYDHTEPGHCTDKCCIMKPEAPVLSKEQQEEFDSYRRFQEDLGFRVELNMPELPGDFCLPCKADIRDTYEDHLVQLQVARFMSGTVSPVRQILERPLY